MKADGCCFGEEEAHKNPWERTEKKRSDMKFCRWKNRAWQHMSDNVRILLVVIFIEFI